MSPIYLQYHNCEQQGTLPHPLAQQQARLQIYTRQISAMKASGRVILIAGLGQPRQYYLWSTFTIDRCQKQPDGQILLEGTGWQLSPPQLLEEINFSKFKKTCANFIGFRQISDLPYSASLIQLAERYQLPGKITQDIKLLQSLQKIVISSSIQQQLAERIQLLEHSQQGLGDEPTVALSIRQPHVEAIFLGIKTIEYRRCTTHRRGRILIYSAKLFAENLDHWLKEYALKHVNLDELPRGVVVGSVELFKCDGGNWHLRNPVRAKTLRRPTGKPQPIWFTPFS